MLHPHLCAEFKHASVKIFTGTWNMAEQDCPDNILEFVQPGLDVYAIGVQECMDLDGLRRMSCSRRILPPPNSPPHPAVRRPPAPPIPLAHTGKVKAGLGNGYIEMHNHIGKVGFGYHGYIALIVLVAEWLVVKGIVDCSRVVRKSVCLGKNLVVTRASNKGAVYV